MLSQWIFPCEVEANNSRAVCLWNLYTVSILLFKTCNQLELVYQSVHEVISIWKCHLECRQPQVSTRICTQFSSKCCQPHLLNSTSCLCGNGFPWAIALRNLFFPSFSETKSFANQAHWTSGAKGSKVKTLKAAKQWGSFFSSGIGLAT